VDVGALASVISSALVGVSVAFYTAHRTAKTAREGRVEQRSADGYLKVLSLVEQEAQWLDSRVFNFDLDRKELEYGIISLMQVPKPALTDRATAAALIAALASEPVRASHVAWRTAADDLAMKLDAIGFAMREDRSDAVTRSGHAEPTAFSVPESSIGHTPTSTKITRAEPLLADTGQMTPLRRRKQPYGPGSEVRTTAKACLAVV
jgi:hypothetical protein